MTIFYVDFKSYWFYCCEESEEVVHILRVLKYNTITITQTYKYIYNINIVPYFEGTEMQSLEKTEVI